MAVLVHSHGRRQFFWPPLKRVCVGMQFELMRTLDPEIGCRASSSLRWPFRLLICTPGGFGTLQQAKQKSLSEFEAACDRSRLC